MRKLWIVTCMVALAAWMGGETLAKKGGNGNGGGGDPTPAGRIYFAHDGGPSTDVRSVLADGTEETIESTAQWVTAPDGHLSYERHGAAGDEVYWSLESGGTGESAVVARRDGNELELTSGSQWVYAVRWGKGDAFISYVAIQSTGSGGAEAHLYTAGVSWSGGEPSLTETPVQQFEVPTFGSNPVESAVAFFDWSPDGSEVAYELNGEIWVRELGAAAPSSALRAGLTPAWSPDGLSIAFVDGGLWTMDSDGGNATELVSDSSKNTVYGPPAWSPDGNDLAFITGSRRRGSIPSGLSTVDHDIARVPAAGGGVEKVTDDGGSDDRLGAWRDD